MAIELSYLLITPYTLRKSRTGGIIARLLSRTDLKLVGAQMIIPTQEFTDAYAESLEKSVAKRDVKAAKLLKDYVSWTFAPEPYGHRVMILLFEGEAACSKLFHIAGKFFSESDSKEENIQGETIRDTYADLVLDNKTKEVVYFEPAVLTPPIQNLAFDKLKLIADFASKQSNIVVNPSTQDNIEQTLVIIKPDNWRHPSSKPGNIIDMLSRTGLRMTGCKIYNMTRDAALEFYGPVQEILREKLSPMFAKRAKLAIEKELKVELSDSSFETLITSVGKDCADDQFYQIIEFMSGSRADKEPNNEGGQVKCMVLIYEGQKAIDKIREVLGSTDPTKAIGGTVRRDFGSDIMVNTAHASDSVESVEREKKVINIDKNELSDIIYKYIKKNKGV